MKKQFILDFLIPLLILSCLTIVFWFTNADIALEELFYSSESGWFLNDKNPWHFLYHYGNVPAFVLASSAIIAFALSFFPRNLLPYKKISLFLVFLLIIGPGIIVNTVFKNYSGRPRPAQIENFGGKEKFLPVWQKGVCRDCKSFPSGHAAIGYYLFSPFFFLRRVSKRWALFFLCAGISYGTLMGIGRMIQGGHFASDVLWSGGFVYLTGLTLYFVFRFDKEILVKSKE